MRIRVQDKKVSITFFYYDHLENVSAKNYYLQRETKTIKYLGIKSKKKISKISR